MSELLPATFPTEERATQWSRHIKRHEVVGIEQAKERPGRWQVRIKRGVKVEERSAGEQEVGEGS